VCNTANTVKQWPIGHKLGLWKLLHIIYSLRGVGGGLIPSIPPRKYATAQSTSIITGGDSDGFRCGTSSAPAAEGYRLSGGKVEKSEEKNRRAKSQWRGAIAPETGERSRYRSGALAAGHAKGHARNARNAGVPSASKAAAHNTGRPRSRVIYYCSEQFKILHEVNSARTRYCNDIIPQVLTRRARAATANI